MRTNFEGRTIVDDMIDGCAGVVERPVAIRGIRAVCKYFGGQLLYIPVNKTTGATTEELLGTLRDAVGDDAAARMQEKLMALLGGNQIYVPMEKKVFRQIIAREIYERYDGKNETIRDLCREYGASFTYVYRLWHRGREERAQGLLDFE